MKLIEHRGHWVPQGSEKAWNRYNSKASDMQLAVDLCEKLRTVVQAGGNIGAWPVWLSHHFIEVITFEPEPTNFACLEKNTAKFKNIEAHFAALGAEVGTAKLNVCQSIGSHHLTQQPGDTHVLTIDGFNLEHCDLIVLDIEGAEALALQGAQETLTRCRPVVMFESKGHGTKKGFGLTHEDIVAQLPNYILAEKVRHDCIFLPIERTPEFTR